MWVCVCVCVCVRVCGCACVFVDWWVWSYIYLSALRTQATRNALHGEDPLEKLGTDWNNLDIENILTHTLFAVQPLHLSDYCANMVPECKEMPERLMGTLVIHVCTVASYYVVSTGFPSNVKGRESYCVS